MTMHFLTLSYFCSKGYMATNSRAIDLSRTKNIIGENGLEFLANLIGKMATKLITNYCSWWRYCHQITDRRLHIIISLVGQQKKMGMGIS